MAAYAYIFNLVKQKTDETAEGLKETDQRIGGLVTREELERHIDRIQADKYRLHVENLARLDKIDDAIVRLHARLEGE